MMEFPTRDKIKKGDKVFVELKKDQGSGNLTMGYVKEILTSENVHPHGILVELEDGQKGRVKKILNSKDLSNKSNKKPLENINNNRLIKIPKEEDLHNEFKSSFRAHLKRIEHGDGQKVPDKNVEKEISVTIGAFANADGGILYLGVGDDGTVLGLEQDFEILKKPNLDKFQRTIWQSIQNYLNNMTFVSKLTISTHKIKNKIICFIEVPPSSEPIFVHDKNLQESYVRIGPKSEKFSAAEFMKYCKTRFD